MSNEGQRIIVIDLTDENSEPRVTFIKKRKPLGDITREMENVENGGEHSTYRPAARARRSRTRSASPGDANNENAAPVPPSQGRGLTGNEGYCVKCRQKRPMRDARQIMTANHRKAIQGKCSICGTKMRRFI